MSDDSSDRVYDFDGSDHARTEERKKEDELRRAKKLVLLQRLLGDPVARDWFWGLLQEFDTFGVTFGISPGGFPDPIATSYHAGRRSAGWRIWTELDDVAPELASLMRREHR